MMRFHVLTLFPDMIEEGAHNSILARAMDKGLIGVEAVNIRDYTQNRHGREERGEDASEQRPVRTVYLSPQGKVFSQEIAEELSREEDLILLCGHYEGIDERVLEEIVTDEISIGDYVLTGGELPALVLIDAVSRLVPGVLGNDVSAETDSFQDGLLEYPQYSRPEEWRGKKVPPILLSGDHAKVDAWRKEQSVQRTKERRPDLYEKYLISLEHPEEM